MTESNINLKGNKYDFKKLGLNIQRARKEKGYSQDQLAYILGYKTIATISNIETGNVKKMDIALLSVISHVLDVDLNILIKDCFKEEE